MDVKLTLSEIDVDGRLVEYERDDEVVLLRICRHDKPEFSKAEHEFKKRNRKAIARGQLSDFAARKKACQLMAQHIWTWFDERRIDDRSKPAFTGRGPDGKPAPIKDTEENRALILLYNEDLREFVATESKSEADFLRAEAAAAGKESPPGSPGATGTEVAAG